jgi:hypothetical protein
VERPQLVLGRRHLTYPAGVLDADVRHGW